MSFRTKTASGFFSPNKLRKKSNIYFVLSDDGNAWATSEEGNKVCEINCYSVYKKSPCTKYGYKPYPAEELANAKVVATYKGENPDADQDELWDK